MKRGLFFAVLGSTALISCGNLFDPAAAVVDGTKLTLANVEDEVERFRKTPRYEQLVARAPKSEIERDFQQTYLTLLIREAVLEGEAEERDIEVTPEEVNTRLSDIREQIGSEGQFQEALKEEGLTLEQLEFQVRVQLLGEELRSEVTKDVGATEDELRDYYEDHIEDYQEVRVQHILVGTQKESLATDLSSQLQISKSREIDRLFDSLAKKHSQDASNADNGGDLGWAPPSQYVEPFAEAVTELEVGVISEPVETEFGWHVIRVTGRRVTPFEEARASIEEVTGSEAVDEAWQDWLADAYEEADIRVNDKFGRLDPESQSVENAGAEDLPGAEAPREPPNPSPTP
jgi:foldase protein PrsA